jgi:hypothetical protein
MNFIEIFQYLHLRLKYSLIIHEENSKEMNVLINVKLIVNRIKVCP